MTWLSQQAAHLDLGYSQEVGKGRSKGKDRPLEEFPTHKAFSSSSWVASSSSSPTDGDCIEQPRRSPNSDSVSWHAPGAQWGSRGRSSGKGRWEYRASPPNQVSFPRDVISSSDSREIPNESSIGGTSRSQVSQPEGRSSKLPAAVESAGSGWHDSGQCTPCIRWITKRCIAGSACQNCHMPHPEVIKNKKCRPSKQVRNKRDRARKLLEHSQNDKLSADSAGLKLEALKVNAMDEQSSKDDSNSSTADDDNAGMQLNLELSMEATAVRSGGDDD